MLHYLYIHHTLCITTVCGPSCDVSSDAISLGNITFLNNFPKASQGFGEDSFGPLTILRRNCSVCEYSTPIHHFCPWFGLKPSLLSPGCNAWIGCSSAKGRTHSGQNSTISTPVATWTSLHDGIANMTSHKTDHKIKMVRILHSWPHPKTFRVSAPTNRCQLFDMVNLDIPCVGQIVFAGLCSCFQFVVLNDKVLFRFQE